MATSVNKGLVSGLLGMMGLPRMGDLPIDQIVVRRRFLADHKNLISHLTSLSTRSSFLKPR